MFDEGTGDIVALMIVVDGFVVCWVVLLAMPYMMHMEQNNKTAIRAAILMVSCCFFENSDGFGGTGGVGRL